MQIQARRCAMQKSHAADRGSEQPTPAQLMELFAQINSGRVTKEGLQRFLRGSTQPVTVEVARKIMGKKNFFGPEQWREFFGETSQPARIPEIPWTPEELVSPGINQEHFLFLGLESFNGKPLDLGKWYCVFPGKDHPKFYLDWYLTHDFAQKTGGIRWYLMPVGIIEGTNNLPWDRQKSMLPEKYEIPLAIERVSANVLFYLLNGKYMDTDYWALTSDNPDPYKGYPNIQIVVRGYSSYGLGVRNWFGDTNSSIGGVAASRKL